MRTPDEIRSISFTKTAMGGYKQSEVDEFIDEIAVQIENMALKMKDYDIRNRELEDKLSSNAVSQSGIQSILVAAQRVADEVEKDAKDNAAKLLADAKEKKSEIDAKCEQAMSIARERIEADKKAADEKASKVISDATEKAESLVKEAKESVEKERTRLEKLRSDTAAFKKQLSSLLSEQADLLKQIPDAPSVSSFDRGDRRPAYDFRRTPVEAPIHKESAHDGQTKDAGSEAKVKTYTFEDDEPVMKSES